jgi:hypothetical protein
LRFELIDGKKSSPKFQRVFTKILKKERTLMLYIR